MEQDKCIGWVYAVTGTRTTIVLNDDIENLTRNYKGEVYSIGQIGSYVVIPEGSSQVVGMVFQIRMTDLAEKLANDGDMELPLDKKVIEVQLLGTLRDGKFERGISTYPNVKSQVYMTDKEDLERIFARYQEHGFSVGDISVFEGRRAFLEPNLFFGKHIAVLGSTGAGKSCTVASILQKASALEHARVIILDLHNEYSAAFPDANCLHTPEFELPYWLMNFDELQEVFIDQTENSAHNQVMVFKEEVIASKLKHNPDLEDAVTIDTPVYFDIQDVYDRVAYLDKEMVPGSQGKPVKGPFNGHLTRFALRLESRLNDSRYAFILKPQTYNSSATLNSLLSSLLGESESKQVTILDLSGTPSDVRDAVVSLLSRTIFDFNFWNEARKDYPILLVLEEAHSYLPQSSDTTFKASRRSVERIAKEGRKYGVSVMIVSQRPSEVSETIVSQCNNFVNLRLTNPNDQGYVKKLVPDALSDLTDVLPSLRQGEALVIGDAVVLPTRVKIDMPSPEPDSADIKFFEKWRKPEANTDIAKVVDNWWHQRKSS